MAAFPGHERRPAFVAPDAIPWFLLEVVGAQAGPTDVQKLTKTTHIQRLNTTGGKPPSSPCGQGEVDNKELVEYTADCFFYKNRHDRRRSGRVFGRGQPCYARDSLTAVL